MVAPVKLPKSSEPLLGGSRSDTAPFCKVPRALACSRQGARGDQTYRGGHEGLDSLSAAALELLATTRLSRAHLLLGFVAARAAVATLAPGDRAMLRLGCLASRPYWSRSSRTRGQHKMERGGVGGRLRGCSPLDGKLRPACSSHLCPGGARAAPLCPQGLCGLPGAALAHRPRGAVGLGDCRAPPSTAALPPSSCARPRPLVPHGVGRVLASQFCPPNPAQPQIRAASLLCSSLFLLLLPPNEQLIILGAGKCLIVVN